MAKVFIEESTLSAIGDAIRNKTGKADLIDPALMSTEIASIEAGGGDTGIPEEAFTLTDNCNYRFANGNWDWFIENYGNRMKTEGITNLSYAFYSTKLTRIPFTLNITDCPSFSNMFESAKNLTECPRIRGTIRASTTVDLSSALNHCNRLRDVEDLFEPEMLDYFSALKVTSASSSPRALRLYNCHSLRRLPSWYNKFRLNPESTVYPSTTFSSYLYYFYGAYAIDELRDLPVWVCSGSAAVTSNICSNISNICRAKSITFETPNGQPVAVNWKSQTINLTTDVGYTPGIIGYITDYNSGITADKEVKDDATYQALKNDPDWFATKSAYSRYNHDSAVETINSLPDTSAYLASAGGTNTIKFKGASGELTDGGAINTLTAEEIAVAAAKGWTVTLV